MPAALQPTISQLDPPATPAAIAAVMLRWGSCPMLTASVGRMSRWDRLATPVATAARTRRLGLAPMQAALVLPTGQGARERTPAALLAPIAPPAQARTLTATTA